MLKGVAGVLHAELAAGHVDVDAVDVAGAIRGDEDERVCQIFGLAVAVRGNVADLVGR